MTSEIAILFKNVRIYFVSGAMYLNLCFSQKKNLNLLRTKSIWIKIITERIKISILFPGFGKKKKDL